MVLTLKGCQLSPPTFAGTAEVAFLGIQRKEVLLGNKQPWLPPSL
jgi:hypothetical protein